MPAPFPGMDPFLEGHLWPDVHQSLALEIRNRLVPAIRPRHFARIAVSVVADQDPELEIGILYPGIEVLERASPTGDEGRPSGPAARGELTAPLTIPALTGIEHRVPSVEIRDRAGNELVTSIEILSPVDKREPELTSYRRKRRSLQCAGVHLVEIDLIRRGSRPVASRSIPADIAYLVLLTREGHARTEVWPLTLADRLPSIPVPLRSPDPDVPIDLGAVLGTVYGQAGYGDEIDYRAEPPPPALTAAGRLVLDDVRARLA